jgi:hypothetical protein
LRDERLEERLELSERRGVMSGGGTCSTSMPRRLATATIQLSDPKSRPTTDIPEKEAVKIVTKKERHL